MRNPGKALARAMSKADRNYGRSAKANKKALDIEAGIQAHHKANPGTHRSDYGVENENILKQQRKAVRLEGRGNVAFQKGLAKKDGKITAEERAGIKKVKQENKYANKVMRSAKGFRSNELNSLEAGKKWQKSFDKTYKIAAKAKAKGVDSRVKSVMKKYEI